LKAESYRLHLDIKFIYFELVLSIGRCRMMQAKFKIMRLF
jgi:hypothetical protein